jgi:hypothetical protein
MYKCFVIKSEGKRTCGKSSNGWKDNIEPDGDLLVHGGDFSLEYVSGY